MPNIILGSDGIAVRQGIYEESSILKAALGRFIDFEDGRRFRYCKASGAITKGVMASAAAVDADDNTVTQTGMTVALSNGYIGEKVINVILASATTANLYEDGLFHVESGTGLGQCHKIRKNKAGGLAVATPCELTLYDPLLVALDATSVITLTKNKYKDVVAAPTTMVAPVIGIPLLTVTTGGYYFWAQTRGYAPILVSTSQTLTIGDKICEGVTVAGSGDVCGGDTEPTWGICVQIGAADGYGIVDLHLE